jgi:NADH dehydrogenase
MEALAMSRLAMHRIVIVGGGAGGLELAVRLGRTLGRGKRAAVTLIDRNLTHLWKPLLHEVAAGTLDPGVEALDYLDLARRNGFIFRPGRMVGLDRTARQVQLAGLADDHDRQVLAPSVVDYDTLVVAVGSRTHDYGIAGVREHCVFLDDRRQADRFHEMLLNHFLQLQYIADGQNGSGSPLAVAIVGAGATGVELAAELDNVAHRFRGLGFDHLAASRPIRIVLIEAAPRILPALPQRLATAAAAELRRIGVEVRCDSAVRQVTAEGIALASGDTVSAHLKVWAAGIEAPAFLDNLEGLETNRIHQLVVGQNLTTTRDPDIFAIGDCAACPRPGSDRPVPARSQAAHQQAAVLARSIVRRLDGRPPLDFVYRDHGALVSLARLSVGNLMGKLRGSLFIEGWLAHLVYRMLYRSHQWVVHGAGRTLLVMAADRMTRRIRPRLKLH